MSEGRICKECGGKIPKESRRRKYCCEECYKTSAKEVVRKSVAKIRLKYLNSPCIVKHSKVCYKCGVEKEIKEFSKDKYSIDGYSYDCKICREERKKEYRKTENAKVVRRKREKENRKENPFYRLRKNFSSMFWRCLRERVKKNTSTFDLLPYSFEELKTHLEKQFDDKMTWNNYGSYWSTDHIIPQSKLLFDSYNHPNFQKCWSLENLRPLEARENIRKGNKILGENGE